VRKSFGNQSHGTLLKRAEAK